MSAYLGDFRTGKTIRKMWNSNAIAGESITRATNGTISVYKDGGTTQSTTGVTDTEDFDSLTGVHLVAIDTSADGTFYSAGSDFEAVLSAATIDGKTINATLFSFSLENRSALMPTTDGRKLDVSAGGEGGVDWANVGSPTTTLNLSGTTVKTATDVETDTQDIQSRLPAALVSGRMNSDVVAISGDSNAADNLERWFDGTVGFTTSGSTLGLAALTVSEGVAITQSTLGGSGLTIEGNGTGHGILVTGGAAANGIHVIGGGVGMKIIGTNDDALYLDGGTSHHGLLALGGASGDGNGIKAEARSGNSAGFLSKGFGQGAGFRCTGGETGEGFYAAGGATSGAGIRATVVSGSEIDADLVGNITGNLSGSVGSVTGNVGGNVTGTVGGFTTAAKAEIETEANDALVANHLDHLLAADYDPTSKPGVATALLNELIESDAGVSQFTANALEEAPSGGGGGSTNNINVEITDTRVE
jgi:uncharacterized protein YaiE (UPF0345 family)